MKIYVKHVGEKLSTYDFSSQDAYSNLPNNRAGWNKRAGWTFFKVYCTFIRQAIVKTGKKGPNKDVQDGFFPKKNKVCCTIIWQVKVIIIVNL